METTCEKTTNHLVKTLKTLDHILKLTLMKMHTI